MGPIGPYGETSNVQFTANKALSSSTTRCKLFHISKPKNMSIFPGAQLWANTLVRIRTEDMIEKVRRSSNISDRTKCHLENEFRKRVISLFSINCYCLCLEKNLENLWFFEIFFRLSGFPHIEPMCNRLISVSIFYRLYSIWQNV